MDFQVKLIDKYLKKIIDTMKYDEEHLKNVINIMLFLKTWTDFSAKWKKKYYLKNEKKNFYFASKKFSGLIDKLSLERVVLSICNSKLLKCPLHKSMLNY